MADKHFAGKIEKILNEYGYGSLNKMPVQQAQWPTPQPQEQPSVTTPMNPESAETAAPGSDTTVVTNGETTPMGEPRADVAAQNGQQFDSDTMGEVGSLLITIGHLLAKDGHVTDKFDTPSVLAFLSKNFQVIPSVDQSPDADDCGQPEVDVTTVQPDSAVNAEPVQPPMPMGADYMEQRKMFESKFKK